MVLFTDIFFADDGYHVAEISSRGSKDIAGDNVDDIIILGAF